MYKPSKYNLFVPLKNGDSLAYNTISGALSVWDKDDIHTYNHLTSCSFQDIGDAIDKHPDQIDQIKNNLIKGSYIVDEKLDEPRRIKEAFTMNRHNRSALSLTIAPTLTCNFACDYCYQGGGLNTLPISKDVCDTLCEMIEKRSQKLNHVHVAWYGGEPLLAKKELYRLSERIINICSKTKTNYSASMVTNGYYLDIETAENLIKQQIPRVQVTLDGGQNMHDTRRVLKNGSGTYLQILSNIETVVKKTDLAVTLRINIDKRNSDGIDELLEDLKQRNLAGGTDFQLYFAPVNVCSDECLRVSDEVLPLAEYSKIEYELLKKAIAYRLTNATLPAALHSVCAAIKPNGFVILPNGDVHKCWNTVSDKTKKVCTLDQIDEVEKFPLQQKWTTWSPFQLSDCEDCLFLPNCSGGCAITSEMNDGKGACLSIKHNIREKIALFASTNNVIKLDDVIE